MTAYRTPAPRREDPPVKHPPSKARRALHVAAWLPPSVALAVGYGTENAAHGVSAFFVTVAIIAGVAVLGILDGAL